MFDVTIIERALRARASDSDREISQEHMALLLYWAYGWTLTNRGSRLFAGGIVASEIGPMPRQWTERPRAPIVGRRKTEAASVTWVVESTWVSLSRVQRPVDTWAICPRFQSSKTASSSRNSGSGFSAVLAPARRPLQRSFAAVSPQRMSATARLHSSRSL